MTMDKERNFKRDLFCDSRRRPYWARMLCCQNNEPCTPWMTLKIPPLVLGGSVVVCCVSCCCGKDGGGGARVGWSVNDATTTLLHVCWEKVTITCLGSPGHLDDLELITCSPLQFHLALLERTHLQGAFHMTVRQS